MSFRFWLFLAGISAAAAVGMAAYGTHGLTNLTALERSAFDTGQLYHLIHSIALFALAGLMAATDGRRTAWSDGLLQMACVAFLVGIVMFSGGIYYHIIENVLAVKPVIPAGGASFIAGWLLLALSAFGYRRGI